MSKHVDLFGAVPDTATELEQLKQSKLPASEPNVANPRPITPNRDGKLGPTCPLGTLTEQMGPVVDEIRQLYTDFGQRPYRVFSVRYRWTGGADGLGRPELVEEVEFLPTPRVDGDTLRTEMKAAGEDEAGYVTLSEISPRYTEDEVRSMTFCGTMPDGNLAFIEVRMDARDGSAPVRRRLTVADVPWRDAENFQWSASAYIQEEARGRDGQFSLRNLFPGDG